MKMKMKMKNLYKIIKYKIWGNNKKKKKKIMELNEKLISGYLYYYITFLLFVSLSICLSLIPPTVYSEEERKNFFFPFLFV